ncbi:phosphoglycerate kinase [Thermofilum pendens]|uniref:Phosphoglycerate kinase n=1 Tax=Thermofilum pendens (strain DSM 2475 / Hrk 5) TaxID=368408 RepID=A1RY95_THEPD|nr:phosphoglycerate kinase [Thermofilum pendens]ABL78175.1 phosphoglycerate kinase [Thermofilum pendens Hrk 5]
MIEGLGIKTLDDVDVRGKTVGVRVDFNSPVDPQTKRLLDDTRIRAHAETTIRELVEKKAKVVVLSHQGRKGDPDFTSLREHAEVLSRLVPARVKFVDDIFGEKAVKEIKALSPGEVLVLENVRMWDGEAKNASPEEHAKTPLVQALAPLLEVYVVDAFSAAHRPHASLVGFAPVVKHFVAGRVMERELQALYRVRNNPERPCVYVIGGAKAEDTAEIISSVLGNNIADKVLTGGLAANLLLHSSGKKIGDVNVSVLKEKGFLDLEPELKKLLDKYGDRIVLPVDLAVEESGKRVEVGVDSVPNLPIKDIGSRTAEEYARIISEARTVVMNGPMGVFEDEKFSLGTKKVFEAMASSKAFTLIGGGHTIAAASKLGFADKLSHVSTGGGALIEYLIKGTLPVIEVLKKYSK